MNKKIALITGASRGIGRKLAESFIDNNFHVIAVARSLSPLEELDDYAKSKNSSITIAQLDISNFDLIDELGYQIFQKFGKLDIFIGNAAIFSGCTPTSHIKPSIWQKIIDVNLTANFRFIRSFDALLRASDAARVVFLTSEIAKISSAYYAAYGASKAGLEALAKIYANEVAKTNIKVNLFCPNKVKTNHFSEAFPGIKNDDYTNPEAIVDILLKLVREELNDNGQIFKTETQFA